MDLITTMLFYWIAIFAVYVMLNRGVWVFTDVSKSMSMFMLEKALGLSATSPTASQLLTALEREWKKKHTCVAHSQCAQLEEKKKK